jgi:hypothetical protein
MKANVAPQNTSATFSKSILAKVRADSTSLARRITAYMRMLYKIDASVQGSPETKETHYPHERDVWLDPVRSTDPSIIERG